MLPSSADLIETFSLLDDWEARYAYLIDLGRMLPPMDPALKTDAVLVPGCTSRVWLVVEKKMRHPGQAEGATRDLQPQQNQKIPDNGSRHFRDDDEEIFHFTIDSDAAIVKGLCAVLMILMQDRNGPEIRALDMEGIFNRLGLATHLSPNRRNGFFAMVERVRVLTAS